MTSSEEHEALLRFVYQIPVGVAQLSSEGELGMTNPAALQLTLQIMPGTLNLFSLLARTAPEVELIVRGFEANRGTILEDYRVDFGKRDPSAAFKLVVSFTITRLSPDTTIVLMNDVSRSVAAERTRRSREMVAHERAVRDYCVLSVDRAGIISDWTRSAERLFGAAASDMEGQSVNRLTRERQLDLSDLIGRASRWGWAIHEGWWRRKDGSHFWGAASFAIEDNEGGAISSLLCIVRDQSDAVLPHVCGADIDPRTGALRSESLIRYEQRLIESLKEHPRPVALIDVVIDGFEGLKHGLPEETQCDLLKSVVRTVQGNLRQNDALFVRGENRFVAILPDANVYTARAAAENIRSCQERQVFESDWALKKVTLSLGVTVFGGPDTRFSDALARVAEAAELAAQRGQNQVVVRHPAEALAALN